MTFVIRLPRQLLRMTLRSHRTISLTRLHLTTTSISADTNSPAIELPTSLIYNSVPTRLCKTRLAVHRTVIERMLHGRDRTPCSYRRDLISLAARWTVALRTNRSKIAQLTRKRASSTLSTSTPCLRRHVALRYASFQHNTPRPRDRSSLHKTCSHLLRDRLHATSGLSRDKVGVAGGCRFETYNLRTADHATNYEACNREEVVSPFKAPMT
jgi:hypothetical protein